MKILYTFLNFNHYTGSEMYYYELAKEMRKLGHKVTISSVCDGDIKIRAEKFGIKCVSFRDIKFFGEYDIIHASHTPIVKGLLNYPISCPLVITNHSEILELEKVRNHDKISHFIGIRESIYNGLPEKKRSLIFNPVDHKRFNIFHHEIKPASKCIYFPGTVNALREEAIKETIKMYPDREIWVTGDIHAEKIKSDNIKYMPSRWDTEEIMQRAHLVAGIIKGRTYIESMMCGVDYLDFNVNQKGQIQSKELIKYSPKHLLFGKVPMEDCYSENVAKKIEELYIRLIKKYKI